MDILKMLQNCKVVSNVSKEEDEKSWLAARSLGIGGSDIGAICGVSPFSSARQVYLKKTGQYPEGLSIDAGSKERMHFGNMLEPVVAEEYATRTGFRLVSVNATLAHKDYPWALANVDRFIIDNDGNIYGVLECKTTSEYMNDEWDSGEILESYMYQLQWYMWILGLERGAFACLVGGNKFYSYDVLRNDELINDVLLPAASDFWFNNVLALKEPPLQCTDKDMVNEMHSDVVKGSEIFDIEDTTDDLVETIVECKAQIKKLEKVVDAAQNRIKEKMDTNEILHTKNYVVKWSAQSQKRIDSEALRQNFPDIATECTKVISFRKMTIKGEK